MTSKMTRQQQKETWKLLQKKVGGYHLKERGGKVLTQTQKNQKLQKAVFSCDDSEFIKYLEMGGIIPLEEVIVGTHFMLDRALENKLPIHNLDELWERVFDTDEKKAALLIRNKTPYNSNTIETFWKTWLDDSGDWNEILKIWLDCGNSLIPSKMSKSKSKDFHAVFKEVLGKFIENETSDTIYRTLTQINLESKNGSCNPIDAICLTEDADDIWNKMVNYYMDDCLQISKILLEFGLFPNPKDELNLGWASKSFFQHNISLFELFMKDKTQKELFSENIKEVGIDLFLELNPILDSKRIELLIKMGLDFEEIDENGNSLLQSIFSYIQDRYDENHQPFKVSKNVLDLFSKHAAFITTITPHENKEKYSPFDEIEDSVSFQTPQGLQTKGDLMVILDRAVLNQTIAKSSKPSVVKQRL